MRSGQELRWILEGFTPDTIPMVRLAAYMQQLAKLLGEDRNVHFTRIENNCVAVVSRVDGGEPLARVNARAVAVGRGDGPKDAMQAYEAINEMLAEDEGSARLKNRSATVIRFPGKVRREDQRIRVADIGSVVGHLYHLSSTGAEVKARLRPDNGGVVMCSAPIQMGQNLRQYLFETVRVRGKGVWERSANGGWTVADLTIHDIEAVKTANLRDAITQLRSVGVNWRDDPLQRLKETYEEGDDLQ